MSRCSKHGTKWDPECDECEGKAPESARGSFAAATGSETCVACTWSNTSLLNLGEPGHPRWICHGCCKRMIEALDRIVNYPVHSEPVGGAMAMQDIAHEALSPNNEPERPEANHG